MESSARFVLRHRWWVIAFWVIATLAGALAAGQVPDRLSFNFSVPGQQGERAENALLKAYGVPAQPGYTPVITATDGRPVAQHRADLAAIGDRLRQIPGLQVLDYPSTGDQRFLTDDGRSAFSLIYAPPVQGFVDPLKQQVAKVLAEGVEGRGLQVDVTGYTQLVAGSEQADGPNLLVETVLGGSVRSSSWSSSSPRSWPWCRCWSRRSPSSPPSCWSWG